jgi:hypothetical protein
VTFDTSDLIHHVPAACAISDRWTTGKQRLATTISSNSLRCTYATYFRVVPARNGKPERRP